MSSLTLYDLMIAQLRSGAVMYKADNHAPDDGNMYSMLRMSEGFSYRFIVVHPNSESAFIDECSDAGIPVIPLEKFAEEERKAFLLGRKVQI